MAATKTTQELKENPRKRRKTLKDFQQILKSTAKSSQNI